MISSQDSSYERIWDEYHASLITKQVIGKAILQAQHTELLRAEEAKVLARELHRLYQTSCIKPDESTISR